MTEVDHKVQDVQYVPLCGVCGQPVIQVLAMPSPGVEWVHA